MTATVGRSALTLQPSGTLCAVYQGNHTGLVDGEVARNLDLRNARVGTAQHQQAEDP
jgi:hypothetical protein